MDTQESIFLRGEGDRWYARNSPKFDLAAPERDPAIRLILSQSLRPRRVLEIGASKGWRLEYLRRLFKAKCVGIEPSQRAIAAGRGAYPKVAFRRGVAAQLPVSGTFDLVIVNFVLHWVSREQLLVSMAEIDRVVGERGYLLIGDFLPAVPTKNPYHHLPRKRAYTYKLDYAKVFQASGMYRHVARRVFDHDTHKFGRVSRTDNRAAVTLLEKSRDGWYAEGNNRGLVR